MPSNRKPNDPNNPYRINQKNDKGRIICGAETVEETPCQRSPMLNGRCARHGGKTPGGFASPHSRTFKHSRYLPPQLADRYEEMANDPELRELGAEIALLDTRITELTELLEDNISPKTWKELKRLWSDVEIAAKRDPEAYKQGILALKMWVQDEDIALQNYQRNWEQVMDLVERRRKLIDTEQRRLLMSQQMLTVEQAMMMVTAVIASLREVVFTYADQTTARHILSDAQRKYNELVSLPASRTTVDGVVGEATG